MECSRCRGFMVVHYFVELLSTETRGRAWRCVSCGNIFDRVILANGLRRRRTSPIVKKVRGSRELIAA